MPRGRHSRMLGAAALAALAALAAALAAGPLSARPAAVRVPCPFGSKKNPKIGKGSAHKGTFRVNGAKRRKSTLFSGNVVCTGAAAFTFKIRVGQRDASCTQDPHSSLRVHPREFLLKFLWGNFLCLTHGRGEKPFTTGQAANIITQDPIFRVSVDRRKVGVRVLAGSALVSGRSGEHGAVVVGPGQATRVPAGGDPGEPTAIKLTPREKAALDKLGPSEPPLHFGRPDPTGSPKLGSIFAANTLAVGFNGQSATDAGALTFVKSYFGFLTDSWGIRLSVVSVPSTTTGLKELGSGRIDILLDSPTSPTFGVDALPLFWDSKSQTWSMFMTQDKVYVDALRRFLVSAVYGKKYDVFYRNAFGRPAPYEPLRPVLFPT